MRVIDMKTELMSTGCGTAPGPERMLATDTERLRILLRKTPMQSTDEDNEACGKAVSISHLDLAQSQLFSMGLANTHTAQT